MNHIVNLGFSTRRRNQRGPMPLTGGAASQSVALPVNFAEDLGRARLRPKPRSPPDRLTAGSHASFLQVTRVEQIKPNRIFLLSPAYAGGERARMILSDARSVRSGPAIAQPRTCDFG